MNLLLTVLFIGIVLGISRARYNRQSINAPDLKLVWLLLLAFVPQALVFIIPQTSDNTPTIVAAMVLIVSQLTLLLFIWVNRSLVGFGLLGIGLLLNFLVIVFNGGLMPISPEILGRILPPGEATLHEFPVGTQFGTTKDIVLPIAETRLWWLSDIFVFPFGIPYRFAYSIGDLFIAAGVIGFCWALGGSRHSKHGHTERK